MNPKLPIDYASAMTKAGKLRDEYFKTWQQTESDAALEQWLYYKRVIDYIVNRKK
jgi:hypothetical protein